MSRHLLILGAIVGAAIIWAFVADARPERTGWFGQDGINPGSSTVVPSSSDTATVVIPTRVPPPRSERGEGYAETGFDTDTYVVFEVEPVVCAGMLNFSGYLQSGVSWHDDFSDFILTHDDDYVYEGRVKVLNVYASILEPLPQGYYRTTPMTDRDIEATLYRIEGDRFDIQVPYVKPWLDYPKNVSLNIWGSTEGGRNLLRETRLSSC